MTLDEAIKHCADKIDNTECGLEHRQLRDWLIELKKFKMKCNEKKEYS